MSDEEQVKDSHGRGESILREKSEASAEMSHVERVKDSHGRGKSILTEKGEASAEMSHVERVKDSQRHVKSILGKKDEASAQRVKDTHGWEKIILREKGEASAEIYLYGARVASWKKIGEEQLFTTNRVPCHFEMLQIFHPSEPVQGGIELCFPLFNHKGNGSVSNRYWVEDLNPEHEKSRYPASIDLILDPCLYQKEQSTFPHRYTFRFRVTLKPNGALKLISWILNSHTENLWCSFAYKIHLLVSKIDDILIEGLQFCHYLDHIELAKKQAMVGPQSEAEFQSTEMNQNDSMTFDDGQEVDRVFFSPGRYLFILDSERRRKYVVVKEMDDTWIRYPGEKKAAKLADADDNEDYNRMICIQPAAYRKPGNPNWLPPPQGMNSTHYGPQPTEGRGVFIGRNGVWKGKIEIRAYDTTNVTQEEEEVDKDHKGRLEEHKKKGKISRAEGSGGDSSVPVALEF